MIRSGKGDAYREVPLNALARQVLDEWLEQRKQLAGEDEQALFVCRPRHATVGARDRLRRSARSRGTRALSSPRMCCAIRA